MENEKIKKSDGVYEVKGKLEGDEWTECREKALEILSKKISIKGFRKGHAPKELIRSRINPEDLANEWINQGLNKIYRKVLRDNNLVPFMQPSVNVDEFNDKFLSATFTVTTYPEVTLGEYKGIKIPTDKFEVTDKDIDEEINKVLSDNSTLALKEAPAEMGDTVVFDFKGYVDGKEFEGGSAQNYSLVLGSNQFVPGFEEQLVGATAESKVDVNVTFPEQYIKELAGKQAKFVCMIHEIKTKQVPTLDDEFVKSLSINGVENVEQLKEHERKSIFNRKDKNSKDKHFNDVVNKIIENSAVSFADAVLDNEIKFAKENLNRQLEQNGLTYEQYKQLTGQTDESINEIYRHDCAKNLKTNLVLDKIAQVENLIISDAELNDYLTRVATSYGTDIDSVKKMLQTNGQLDGVRRNLLNNKIHRFIVANNPVVNEETNSTEEKNIEATEKKVTKKPRAKKTTTKADKKED